MVIQTLNLVSHACSAALPIVTRTNSVPRIVEIVIGALPPLLPALALSHWYDEAHSQSLPDSVMRFHAKFFWYLLPGTLTFGHLLSQHLAPEILGNKTSLLADTGVLAAGAIGSFRLFQIGMTGSDPALDIPYTNLALRAVVSVLGISGLAQVADAIKNRALGLFAFQSLDPEQQYFVLKHRSIESLGGPAKSCRAVIIDGKSSNWGNRNDDNSLPLAEELYRKCDVRTYRTDPNAVVCGPAEKGKRALGEPLDILALMSHASRYRMSLNKDTDFTGSSDESACLKDHLKPDAQLILAGCNTATGNNSLAERVSHHLEGIEVVGFSSYTNPFSRTTWWEGKKLRIWGYFFIDSQGNWYLPWTNTVRTFKSGEPSQ